MRSQSTFSKVLVVTTIALFIGCSKIPTNVIFVNANAGEGGTGTSWGNAYAHLQDALKKAVPGYEVWVATGIYKPTGLVGGEGERKKSFLLKNGVELYGGFKGSESNREARDWNINTTILSGDLNGDDEGFENNDENCFHVLTGNGTDSSAVLDGFIITGGNANFDVWPDDGGGGMNNNEGSPTLKNCTFTSNAAFADGGGIRNWGENTNPVIVNCVFTGNYAAQEGGGMMNGPDSKPTIINCKFLSNSSGEDGGGMYNNESYNSWIINCVFSGNKVGLTGGGIYNVNESTPNIINCTFSGNKAEKAGGALANNNGYPQLTNCILWNNSAPLDTEIHESNSSITKISFSLITGGFEGDGNINTDPLFADMDLILSAESPCIDAGNNNAVPDGINTDNNGNARITKASVDMGAYEYN